MSTTLTHLVDIRYTRNMKYISYVFFLLLPTLVQAQNPLVSLGQGIAGFISNGVIPFIAALALLFFVYNVFRFFILGSAEPEGRENAKKLAMYGILAFVFIVAFWGIINFILLGLFGSIDTTRVPQDAF